VSAIGLFSRIKLLARLDAAQAEEPSRELGDLIEPGSVPDLSGMPPGAAGGAASLEQLKGLQASGLIDADTFDLIEASMTNATAEIDRLHASGVMSDEIYAQALASMAAATSGSSPSVDAAELELLQRGESATATVLTMPKQVDEADARLLITLEVHPAAGSPYPADCTLAAINPAGDLKVGDFLRVRVDPDDPKRVAIDWAEFGV
jgi:hypothetical protein